ncbi:MAG: metallophosphoesterase [Gemmatimonadaceae bacterium]
MRVGLLSDSHDRLPAIVALMQRFADEHVEMVLHAGDYCSPFAMRRLLETRVPLAGVFGRNDGDHEGLRAEAMTGMGSELYESPHSFDVGGTRILVVHDIGEVAQRSLDDHGIVVHGFTHRQEMRESGSTLIVNPGESCGWLRGTPTAAILDIAARRVELIRLDDFGD